MSSARAKRMDKHHKRSKPATLSLVSLMDIFTILVFFLLVNQDMMLVPLFALACMATIAP